MGRNKDLRKRIAGLEDIIVAHEVKIRAELAKANPDETLIASWEREIATWKATVARLTRRLKRNW